MIRSAAPISRTGLYAWTTLLSKLALAGHWPPSPLLSLALFVAPEHWMLYHLLVPNAAGLGRIRTRFATGGREVWLTVDDGPDPRTTPALLDLLDAHGAKATFFLVGGKVREHPGLVRAIAERGHGLGNHTDSHPLGFFWCAGPRRVAAEIDGCSDAIEEAAGVRPRLFRPPAGIKNPFLFGALARRGMTFVGWSGRGREHGCRTAGPPLARLLAKVRPGAILLVHESAPGTEVRMAVVAGLLRHLSSEGYRCALPQPPAPVGALAAAGG